MMQYVRSRLIPYLRTQILPSKPAQLLIQTWLRWDGDNVPGMAAALSYYALFSLFPLLLVVLVLATALLLLASLVSNIVIKVILNLVNTFQDTFALWEIDQEALSRGLQAGWSFLALGLAIAGLFRILPTITLSWRDIWPGALLTTLLLAGLQWLVSSSVISLGRRFVSYGVIGSVMILMLWIFLSCQIFFAGCEFSFVYAHIFGIKRRAARLGE